MEWKKKEQTSSSAPIEVNQHQNVAQMLNGVIAQHLEQQEVLREDHQQRKQNERTYSMFLNNLQPLPELPVAEGPGPQEENVGRKERKRRRKEMEARIQKEAEEYGELCKQQRLITASELENIPLFKTKEGRNKWRKKATKHVKSTMGETMDQVRRGDYSNFENLDGFMRNLVASQELNKLHRDFVVNEHTDVNELCERIKSRGEGVSALLNPALRLGLSLAQKSQDVTDDMKSIYRKLDEAMSTAVMVETLVHVPQQSRVEKYYQDKGSKNPQQDAWDAIHANGAQQVQIAKRLLLMQLSKFHKVNNDGTSEPWEHSMAVALSHCSRVSLLMPKQDDNASREQMQKKMWNSIWTNKGTNFAQDKSRASSTHSIERLKVKDSSGQNVKVAKEKKVLFNLIGQRGMNVAIGGLGNEGISNKLLSNDGSCGHFYSMYKEADSSHYGVILMGLESDANGVTNQMGHTHDIHATAEKCSSLGGQRTDEIGKKYGGRQCDLTDCSAEQITNWMSLLENAMEKWYKEPSGMSGTDAVKAMKLLAGHKMDAQGWTEFRKLIGAPADL